MRDFRKLEIWKKGIEIVKHIYALSVKLPVEEKFGLRSQMTRAAVSIPANIAEGCSRNRAIEFKRYLEISIGSLFKVETRLVVAKELEFIAPKELKSFSI